MTGLLSVSRLLQVENIIQERQCYPVNAKQLRGKISSDRQR